MSGIYAIVPIKGLEMAKARLAEPTAGERQALALKMARVTLGALSACRKISKIIVISPDKQVVTLANELGCVSISDPDKGLNAAYASGMDFARAKAAHLILLMPSDFLRLDVADIEDLIISYEEGKVGLLPCKEGTGTNAVILPAKLSFTPLFGVGSFDRHWRQAGERAQLLAAPALAFDIDTDADLALFTAQAKIMMEEFV